MKKRLAISALVLGMVVPLAVKYGKAEAKPRMRKQLFGATTEGAQVDLYVLTNQNGVEVSITNYGGRIVSLKIPDRKGTLADVVLGYDNLDGYLADKAYFGAVIGRYANRIAHGKFTLDGVSYRLARNNGENHLHGGTKGFDKIVWQAQEMTGDEAALRLNYLSKDNEEGYPGNLSVQVVYTLTDQNQLKIDYTATTDKDTVINLSNHSYFNLAGGGKGNILQHQLVIRADRFTPVDATLIPTGELHNVQSTPFDFRSRIAIGARINQDDQQLKFGRGYDHNWVLNSGDSSMPELAAKAYEPESGRTLEVWTTEPGVQFYSGNFLDGTIRGKGGKVYNQRDAFSLETQHFPDSPNHPQFPSTVLKPRQRYRSTTIYKFSIQ